MKQDMETALMKAQAILGPRAFVNESEIYNGWKNEKVCQIGVLNTKVFPAKPEVVYSANKWPLVIQKMENAKLAKERMN